jgi:hypothetical protein
LVSERKFKEQLKNWEFEKNITSAEMGFIAAKEKSRIKEKGKCTIFYSRGITINPKRIYAFKKRINQPVEEIENAGKENDTMMGSSHSDIMGHSNPSAHYIPYSISRRQLRYSSSRATPK